MESIDIDRLTKISSLRELVERLDGDARRRALDLASRIRTLRDSEICTRAALDAAQLELDTCARQAWLSSLRDEQRDAARIDQCEQIRSDVERLERRLVFTRTTLHDQCEEFERLLTAARTADTARRSA